jgi:hypothetical protein
LDAAGSGATYVDLLADAYKNVPEYNGARSSEVLHDILFADPNISATDLDKRYTIEMRNHRIEHRREDSSVLGNLFFESSGFLFDPTTYLGVKAGVSALRAGKRLKSVA